MRFFLQIIFSCIAFTLFPDVLCAQSYMLKGFIAVEGGETFTYRMEFAEGANGSISGFAYTYAQERNDIKASITGSVDRKKKSITFQENEIIHNNGFRSNALMCLVRSTLVYEGSGSNAFLAGPLTSNTALNGYCGKGTINIRDTALERLFSSMPAGRAAAPEKARSKVPEQPMPPMKIVYDTARRQQPAISSTPVVKEITQGREGIYDWNSDSVIIEVWDGGQIDGDVISLLYNDRPLLVRHKLTAAKRRLSVPLGSNTDIINILAEQDGSEPPVTVNILLTDGTMEHEILAHNQVGREAVIRIRRKAQ